MVHTIAKEYVVFFLGGVKCVSVKCVEESGGSKYEDSLAVNCEGKTSLCEGCVESVGKCLKEKNDLE